ncbi:hypothetical protein F5Y06DRAFT_306243 [Hypoxylon sp. FL0890]|nr:hypothetical protein F5Y06DRAFT_306243 [Hypoxylon sp. FL0890]
MPRTCYPPLYKLFYKGFHGGLRWQTQARDAYDERIQCNTKRCRFLLHHPHSFHLAKVIVRGLKTARPILVSLALADIYNFAVEKVWISIFINTVLRSSEEIPAGPPLVQALDNFRDAFSTTYPVNHLSVLGAYDSRCKENLELAEDEVAANKRVHERYFPYHLTNYNGQGDGTDKMIGDIGEIQNAWKEVAASFAPKEEELDLSKVPDEELFFYDTECKAKRHDAFKDAPASQGSSRQKLGEKESIRKYDAFRGYRETAREDEDGDRDEAEARVGDHEEYDEDEVMMEAGESEVLPHFKKLKITG